MISLNGHVINVPAVLSTAFFLPVMLELEELLLIFQSGGVDSPAASLASLSLSACLSFIFFFCNSQAIKAGVSFLTPSSG